MKTGKTVGKKDFNEYSWICSKGCFLALVM